MTKGGTRLTNFLSFELALIMITLMTQKHYAISLRIILTL